MAYTDSMTPKLRAIRARLPDAIKDLNRGNASAILEASQPLVPVDTGSLKHSGRVEPGPAGSSILVYGGRPFTNSRTGKVIDYALFVHVGHRTKSQYVGQPLRAERPARKKATAQAMSKFLKGA